MKKKNKAVVYMTTSKASKMAPVFHNGFGKCQGLGPWNHLNQMEEYAGIEPCWFEFSKTIKVFGRNVVVFYDRDGFLVWRFEDETA